MAGDRSQTGWWWEAIEPGERVSLAFVKVDRVGSTRDWDELPEETVLERRERYTSGIESVARKMNAAQPLHFHGDGVMLFLADKAGQSASVRAFHAARAIWERMAIDLNLPVRIAVHAGEVPWNPDTGQLAHPAIDVCGHLEQAAASRSIAVTERIFLALPEELRQPLAPLGLTTRDRTPAYVFPASAAERKDPAAFQPDGDLTLWAAFRAYAHSPEICRLRYVGFPLARKEPPSLDVRDVFVRLNVRAQRGFGVIADLDDVPDREGEQENAGIGAPWERLDRQPAAPIRSFREVFAQRRSVVVLGDPGAGKTTLLRWLAVVAADGPDALARELGVAERLLPVPVSLGRLSAIRRERGGVGPVTSALARNFQDRSVGEAVDLEGFLRRQLRAGECLLLLDGLDEVPVDQRAALRGWLEAFAHQWPRNRYVVTSRIVGYEGIMLPDSTEVVVQPFDDEQVDRYADAFCREYRRWETGHDDTAAAAREARGLLQALADSPRLWALARNPFLVSALALIHRAAGRLPRHRVQVYEIFARSLCETWGAARQIVAGDVAPDIAFEEEALPLLGRLARRMHEEWPAGVASEEIVVDTLAAAVAEHTGGTAKEGERAARGFLKRAAEEVQILLERGAGRWGFLHLTFQEFFTAAGLHAREEFEQVAFKHLFDARWQEILRLGTGYYALIQKRPLAAQRFVEKIYHYRLEGRYSWITDVVRKQVPLATLLAAEGGDALPGHLQNTIAGEFLAWYTAMPSEVGDPILGEITLTESRSRIEKPLRDWLAGKDIVKRIISCEALSVLGGKQSFELLMKALEIDPSAWVRQNAAQALGNLGNPDGFASLVIALNDSAQGVREHAAAALGNLPAANALKTLLDHVDADDHALRWGLVKALVSMRHIQTHDALEQLLDDRNWWIARYAARGLTLLNQKRDVDRLLEWLENGADFNRSVAAFGLGGANDPAVMKPLLRALQDRNAAVREMAVLSLTELTAAGMCSRQSVTEGDDGRELGKDPPFRPTPEQSRCDAVIDALLAALTDPEPSVRKAAAKGLGTVGRTAPGVLDALLKALTDNDQLVREHAAQAIGEIGDKQGVPLLLAALGDHYRLVRLAAIQALGALQDEAAVDALVAKRKDRDPAIRRRVMGALWRIAEALPVDGH